MATIVKGYRATQDEPGVEDRVENINARDAESWYASINEDRYYDIMDSYIEENLKDFYEYLAERYSNEIEEFILS